MNKERRKQLQEVVNKISEAHDLLDEILSDEQDAFDNMPEGLQSSERGETMEEGIYNMEEARDNLEDITNTLEEVMG